MLPLEQRDRSEEVHHVDGLGPNGPLGHDWSNLLAMSHSHHSRITATDHRISPLHDARWITLDEIIDEPAIAASVARMRAVRGRPAESDPEGVG